MASSPLTYAYSHQPLPIHETLAVPVDPASDGILTSPDGEKVVTRGRENYTIENKQAREKIFYEDTSSIFATSYQNVSFTADSKYFYYIERPYNDYSNGILRLLRVDADEMSEPVIVKEFRGFAVGSVGSDD